MKSAEIRQMFFDFFISKDHVIVPSAPIVNQDDPTLMFTNAGMNQFKDYFLGTKQPKSHRVADTQKCLRVSGKHNDLEEVGVDSYHHTMFEMLGNWSFGDPNDPTAGYFKKEAINWAWELLVDIFGIDPGRIYATVFEGDETDNVKKDEEAASLWREFLPDNRILYCGRKDNFWEMGDTGPCGPCSEIHVDLRSEEERKKIPGEELVNKDHPLVIEIWNLVFIQYNRDSTGKLNNLPAVHVDTGMGFERLCMVLQHVQSNYATDLFTRYFTEIEEITGFKYSDSYDTSNKKDIAFRVIVDHLRAVSFTIADGLMPSNTGAGYVVRRILRRAVRYYYSFLDRSEPMIHLLVPTLADQFKDVFPGLKKEQDFVQKVILEEENSFLQTLASGINKFNSIQPKNGQLDGEAIFELFDTYGFPYDLSALLASEKGLSIDKSAFDTAMEKQKSRSRKAQEQHVGDWVIVKDSKSNDFVGYDENKTENVSITRYRKIITPDGQDAYEAVLDITPFYAESGGQVGDTGWLLSDEEVIPVLNTQKENDLNLITIESIPSQTNKTVTASVDKERRSDITKNHSATHLLHAALREVLGDHVAQRGSYLDNKGLRFDFSHFEKVSDDQLAEIERIVNEKIREDIPLEERRSIPLEEAKAEGATMLFGEKYGDHVRMITFDPDFSRELCGGCHVKSTAEIAQFLITNETAVASGVRRIEAVTDKEVIKILRNDREKLHEIQGQFKNSQDLVGQIQKLLEENKELKKGLEQLQAKSAGSLKDDLINEMKPLDNDIVFLAKEVNLPNPKLLKSLLFDLEKSKNPSVIFLAMKQDGKAQIMGISSEDLVKSRSVNIGSIISEISPLIKGGGGGQANFASAGGSNPDGIQDALTKARDLISKL